MFNFIEKYFSSSNVCICRTWPEESGAGIDLIHLTTVQKIPIFIQFCRHKRKFLLAHARIEHLSWGHGLVKSNKSKNIVVICHSFSGQVRMMSPVTSRRCWMLRVWCWRPGLAGTGDTSGGGADIVSWCHQPARGRSSSLPRQCRVFQWRCPECHASVEMSTGLRKISQFWRGPQFYGY